MDEPRTAAGRALLDELTDTVVAGGSVREYVVAIEREAVEAARAREWDSIGNLQKAYREGAEAARTEVAEPGATCDPCGHDARLHNGFGCAYAYSGGEPCPCENARLVPRAATAGREPLDALREAAQGVVDQYRNGARYILERDIAALEAAIDSDRAIWRDVVAFIRWSANVRDDESEAITVAKQLLSRIEAARAALDTPDPGAS